MVKKQRWYGTKTVFPHNYSKQFARFKISHTALWSAMVKRLEIEKDNLVIITGDTGNGKSHLAGNLCFKKGNTTLNFIENDGTMMFEDEKHFIIDPDELAIKMIHGSGDMLWVDESRDALSRRNWASKINKTIISRKNKNRKLRKIIFLLLPYERELDSEMVKHATLWIWVKKRGLCEVYCRRSGIKGGSGLNINEILNREDKYFKENPDKSQCPPEVHPEFIGRLAFGKLTANLERRYLDLVEMKKAVGELTDEEKIKAGIEVKREPKVIVLDILDKIKTGEIKDKKMVWDLMQETKLDDDKKMKLLNFYLKLEGWSTFNKLFDKDKVKQVEVDW